jgi:hypothetical protein
VWLRCGVNAAAAGEGLADLFVQCADTDLRQLPDDDRSPFVVCLPRQAGPRDPGGPSLRWHEIFDRARPHSQSARRTHHPSLGFTTPHPTASQASHRLPYGYSHHQQATHPPPKQPPPHTPTTQSIVIMPGGGGGGKKKQQQQQQKRSPKDMAGEEDEDDEEDDSDFEPERTWCLCTMYALVDDDGLDRRPLPLCPLCLRALPLSLLLLPSHSTHSPPLAPQPPPPTNPDSGHGRRRRRQRRCRAGKSQRPGRGRWRGGGGRARAGACRGC